MWMTVGLSREGFLDSRFITLVSRQTPQNIPTVSLSSRPLDGELALGSSSI
jgi:hypothetical protein